MKKTTKIILIAVFIIAIIAAIVTFLLVNSKPKTNLAPITSAEDLSALVDKIYEGETYKELGFIAKDQDNNNLNDRVTIKSELNTNIVGNYVIEYSIETTFKTLVLTRKVNVLKDPLKNIEFTMNGNKVINIFCLSVAVFVIPVIYFY